MANDLKYDVKISMVSICKTKSMLLYLTLGSNNKCVQWSRTALSS